MESKKISIRQLADATGLAVETISRARDERVGSCQLETLARIAEVLLCDIEALYVKDIEGDG